MLVHKNCGYHEGCSGCATYKTFNGRSPDTNTDNSVSTAGPQGRSGWVRKISEFDHPDRPARSESLYRLSYRGPQVDITHT